ncbi:MAG: radical SAM protein [Synergistetes bacterium]|nr:radical SAM protein [Synergistota bacterium]MDK2871630.1 hypothetical protein [bacterium]
MLWEWRRETLRYKEKEHWLKPLWKPEGYLRWALVYPNSYSVGISNLGFLHIYRILASDKEVFVSRFFKWGGYPPLSFEEGRSLSEFDVITFSLSYELDFLNVVRILKNAGIPVLREERSRSSYPIIGVGGIFPTMNPLPLFPIADFIVCGEGEEVVKEIVVILKSLMGRPKEKVLEKLSEVEGVLVPGIKECTSRRWVRDLNEHSLIAPLWTPLNQFRGALLIELNRGCVRSCFFCPVRQCYSPFRVVSLDTIKSLLENVSPQIRLGLISSVASDHPHFEDLLDYLLNEGRKVSFGSFRVEGISEKLLKLLKLSGQNVLTLAPETGNEDLRKRIGKDFSNELIEEKIMLIYNFGFRKIKLYFMIGLPEETISDVNDIVDFVGYLKKTFKDVNFIVNISPFIPKPFTPFEEEPFLSIGELHERIKLIRKLSSVSIRMDGLREAQLEALIARGDAKLGKVISLLDGKVSAKTLEKYVDLKPYLDGKVGVPWKDVVKS